MKIKDLLEILLKFDGVKFRDMAIVFESFDTGGNQYSETEIDEIALKVKTKVLVIRL